MKIKVNVFPYTKKQTNKKSKLLGFASITFDEMFAINSIKIIKTKKSTFVSYPQQERDGEYYGVAFPITKEAREKFDNLILEELNKQIKKQNEDELVEI